MRPENQLVKGKSRTLIVSADTATAGRGVKDQGNYTGIRDDSVARSPNSLCIEQTEPM